MMIVRNLLSRCRIQYSLRFHLINTRFPEENLFNKISRNLTIMSSSKDNRRVLSIQSHVVHGYCGNKSAVFPLQVLKI